MTQDEIEIIFDKWKQYGNSWVKIAAALPTRGDNSVKNIFNSSLRKYMRRMRKLVVCSALRDMIEPSSITIATVKSIIMKDLITRRELEAFSEPLIKDDLIKGMNLQMKTTKLEKLSREEALCRLVSAVNQYSLTQGETFCSQ